MPFFRLRRYHTAKLHFFVFHIFFQIFFAHAVSCLLSFISSAVFTHVRYRLYCYTYLFFFIHISLLLWLEKSFFSFLHISVRLHVCTYATANTATARYNTCAARHSRVVAFPLFEITGNASDDLCRRTAGTMQAPPVHSVIFLSSEEIFLRCGSAQRKPYSAAPAMRSCHNVPQRKGASTRHTLFPHVDAPGANNISARTPIEDTAATLPRYTLCLREERSPTATTHHMSSLYRASFLLLPLPFLHSTYLPETHFSSSFLEDIREPRTSSPSCLFLPPSDLPSEGD